MLWYKSIVLFGVGSNPYDVDADDTDLKLLPSLLEKTVLTKLTGGLSSFHLDKLGLSQPLPCLCLHLGTQSTKLLEISTQKYT